MALEDGRTIVSAATVRAALGRLSALSVFLCKSFFYGAFVWARRALNSPNRRFPARADPAHELRALVEQLPGLAHGARRPQAAGQGKGPRGERAPLPGVTDAAS